MKKKPPSERDTLMRLQETRRRDISRRKAALAQMEQLTKMEEELLDEGKGPVTANRRLMLARRVREVREQVRALNHRIENIYDQRISVLNQHLAALETVVELTDEPVPVRETVEKVAIDARTKLDDLDRASDLGEGIAPSADRPQPDDEERAILEEMKRRADAAREADAPAPKKKTKKHKDLEE